MEYSYLEWTKAQNLDVELTGAAFINFTVGRYCDNLFLVLLVVHKTEKKLNNNNKNYLVVLSEIPIMVIFV